MSHVRAVIDVQLADLDPTGKLGGELVDGAAGDTRRLGDVADCDLLQSLLAEAGIGGGAIVAPSTELDGDFFLRAKSLV